MCFSFPIQQLLCELGVHMGAGNQFAAFLTLEWRMSLRVTH